HRVVGRPHKLVWLERRRVNRPRGYAETKRNVAADLTLLPYHASRDEAWRDWGERRSGRAERRPRPSEKSGRTSGSDGPCCSGGGNGPRRPTAHPRAGAGRHPRGGFSPTPPGSGPPPAPAAPRAVGREPLGRPASPPYN